jgi:hypothetical protein
MDPGSIIALATIAYTGAVKAWTVLHTALHLSEDAEELILRLSLERFRLQTWGSNIGLESGTLHPSLFPVFELMQQVLNRIENTCEKSDALQERYGLSNNAETFSKSERAKDLLRNTKQALHGSGVNFKTSDSVEQDVNVAEHGVPMWKRFRWGLRDKTRFASIIDILESYIRKLNELLTESQKRGSFSDEMRVNIVVIGKAHDEESVELLRKAVQGGSADPKVRNWVERKAISDDRTALTRRTGVQVLRPLRAEDFDLPAERKQLRRAFVQEHGGGRDCFLLERKSFVPGIEASDRNLLVRRLQKLVLLLRSSGTSDLRTLKSIGYLDDIPNSCWWIVYRFLQGTGSGGGGGGKFPLSLSSQPVSLLALLKHQSSNARPALEQRLTLASQMADTLSSLYKSGWMHKGLRSENILFPFTWVAEEPGQLKAFDDVSSPLLAGFEYSRQETEQQTIDKGQDQPLDVAVYRHSYYQGEAACGYKTRYDMYSFGLVLLEIAYWRPLVSFLDAQDTRPQSSNAGGGGSQRIKLSSKMKHFHIDEAEELRQRLVVLMAQDLAFRVGTLYHRAVAWCLGCADLTPTGDHDDNDGKEDEWRPALEFYDHVVEPLARLAETIPDSVLLNDLRGLMDDLAMLNI